MRYFCLLTLIPLVLLAAACRRLDTPLPRGMVPHGFRMLRPLYITHPEALKLARFTNVAEVAGLRYRWTPPGKRPLNILQSIGNGCAFLDFDQDGNLDILLVGPKPALYKGDGKGHFTDVTVMTGLDRLSGYFLGCAVGDVDQDGYPDVYLSGYREARLFHNEGGWSVRDITPESGLKSQPWGSSCAFAETVPGSGRLDLYVANYVDFGPNTEPQLCIKQGLDTGCGPIHYKPLKGVFYRNDGGGHFTDSTDASGLNTATGRGLGVAFADFADYGRPGLAIANDEIQGDLFLPDPGAVEPRYQNIGVASGTAYDHSGNVHGGMGIDWGDYDNDGKLDLFTATFYAEPKSLYHNNGEGLFTDVGERTALGGACLKAVAFGAKFLDYDNDGWLDVVIANGHVQDNVEQVEKGSNYRQPTLLFHNSGAKTNRFGVIELTFAEVGSASPDLQKPIVGRGLAVGDYDNDGRLDFLVTDAEGMPLLFHNETQRTGHWLGIKLVGTKSNKDGYGALLTVKIGKRTLVRHCHADGSYLSSSDPRVHFGLGQATRVDSLTIRWPSGQVDTYKNLAADRYMTMREGSVKP